MFFYLLAAKKKGALICYIKFPSPFQVLLFKAVGPVLLLCWNPYPNHKMKLVSFKDFLEDIQFVEDFILIPDVYNYYVNN